MTADHPALMPPRLAGRRIGAALQRGLLTLAASLLLAACSTTGETPVSAAPVVQRAAGTNRAPGAPAPTPVDPRLALRKLTETLLPESLSRDRAGWAADIAAAFEALQLPAAPASLCAAIAVIEQESGFQADPAVPGLSAIVRREIEARRRRYLIPQQVVDAALSLRSTNGQTWQQRIDALRTERQLSGLYQELIEQLPAGRQLLSGHDPVRTGGPMQVSITYAEAHVRSRPPPPLPGTSVRDAVFSRPGGLYFGIAHLLDYPAPYRDPLYRFADFNAGQYASRNAAFQQALVKLGAGPLQLDGDLLSYRSGRRDDSISATRRAVLRLAPRLQLSTHAIEADLAQEKTADFAATALYRRVFALADAAAGQPLAREILPGIRLVSPKIRSKITTAWFAGRVNTRYGLCLQRNPEVVQRSR